MVTLQSWSLVLDKGVHGKLKSDPLATAVSIKEQFHAPGKSTPEPPTLSNCACEFEFVN